MPKQLWLSQGNSHTRWKPCCIHAGVQGICCLWLLREHKFPGLPFPMTMSFRRAFCLCFSCANLYFFFKGVVILCSEFTLTVNQAAFLSYALAALVHQTAWESLSGPSASGLGSCNKPAARSQHPGTPPASFGGRRGVFRQTPGVL